MRRTNRRLRALLAGVAILLGAALAVGIFASVQRGEARDAADQARETETAQFVQRLGAQALAEEDLGRSLLLARQAVAIEDTPQTRGYLLAALLRAPRAAGIMHAPHDSYLQGIALGPSGRTVVVYDFFGKLLFFNARTNEQIGEPLPHVAWIESLAGSPDGRTLAIGGDQYVRRIDARTRQASPAAAAPGRVMRLGFTKDGSKLVVLAVTPYPSISIRDATTLEPVGRDIEPEGFKASYLRSSYYRPPQFALTPDGRSLITASDAGELAWWSLRSGRRTRALPVAKGYHALAVSRDGRTVVVGIEGGIQLVDVRTGHVRTANAGLTGSPSDVQFSADGRTVVSGNVDGTVTMWEVGSARPREVLRGHSSAVQQLVFGTDGKTLYSVSGDGTAIAWDLAGDRSIERPFRFTHDRNFDEAYDGHPGRLSPDGRLIAVGLKEKGIGLWHADDVTPAGAPLLGTGGEVKALSFSPDGRTLVALTALGEMTIWDVASRSRRGGVMYAAGGFLVDVSFTADGTAFGTSGFGGVDVRDAATGARLRNIGGTFTTSSDVSFSADGRLVAFANPGVGIPRAQLWNLRTGTHVATLEGGGAGDALSVTLSPGGKILAVGGYGRVIRLWDVATRRPLHDLDYGGAGAMTLEFSRDGRTLAVSGFYEPVAALWDVATGTQIGPSLTAGGRAAMMDLSGDGRRLLMTAANGEGAVWDVDPESWKQRACAIANRTLTREEWGEFLPGRPYEPACG